MPNEQQIIEKIKGKTKIIINQDNAYFGTETHDNLESTDVKVILSQMIKEILEGITNYLKNGSGWYFKEVISLEIHVVDYKLMKASTYIPLPDFLMRKKR